MGERIKDVTGIYTQDLKQVGERLWSATQRTMSLAGSRAAYYGKRVQLKIDLATLERRIVDRNAELGEAVYAAWNEGALELRRREELSPILAGLDDLEHQRDELVRELEALRAGRESGEEVREAVGPEVELKAGVEVTPDPEPAWKEDSGEELHL